MARLLLVRHGETTGNSTERYWGRTDIALSETGLRQAERLRDRLAPEKITAVYTSDLGRALRTAEVIASEHEAAITSCPELREIDFGRVEGLTYAEITERYPELAATWTRPDLDFRFPDGEGIAELDTRVAGFLPRLAGHTLEETVLVVAHSGVLRLLLCNLLGMERQHWRQFRLDLASLSILDTYPEVAILRLLNDVSHLR